MALFALLVLVLLGFVGLSIDGGYYFASSRAVSIAADTAARAAAVDVRLGQSSGQTSYYSRASSDGVAIGQRNLASSNLTGITLTIEYNNLPFAGPATGGWYASNPSASTQSVRAIATGTDRTLFLGAVGIPGMDIHRLGQGAPLEPVIALPRALPFAVCTLTTGLTPNGPWRVWDKSNILPNCLVLGWHGLANLDNRPSPTCPTYYGWLSPPPSGPLPIDGTNLQLDTQDCPQIGSPYAEALRNTTQIIPEVSTIAGLFGAQVVGCRVVRVTEATGSRVEVTPQGGRIGCGLVQTN
jgi:hypothetical protein